MTDAARQSPKGTAGAEHTPLMRQYWRAAKYGLK
jgi:hypothetical protein